MYLINNIESIHTLALVKSAFKEYYFRLGKNIELPERIHQHEFGYMQFDSGMVRHLTFKSMGELLAALIRVSPSDVYCSNAYYLFPMNPIQEKQWLGADLIFDIDAKDLHMPCDITHSYFVCSNCKKESENNNTDPCNSCNIGKIKQISLPCAKCISGLKKELRKLLDVLINDIGIEYNDISVYFSGNNGFHVHISNNAFSMLDSRARSDMVSYIMGNGIIPETIGVRKSSVDNFMVKFPKSGLQYGWRKRLAEKLGIDGHSTTKLANVVQKLGGYDFFKLKLVDLAKDMGTKIDPHVTVDVHRVFRLPGTLNSKSGLTKIKCTDIELFDPFYDACLLNDKEVEVKINASVKFKLRGQYFKANKQLVNRLPLYAAVYLICKGLAQAT